MTKIQQFNFICRSVLQIVLFYLLLSWWGYQIDLLVLDLYASTPFILFACCVFFLFLFFCRTMGCLVFMPKEKLKAILQDGEISPPLSQFVLKIFSWSFIKHLLIFFFLFVCEFILRLAFIPLFLKSVSMTIPFWAWLSSFSVVLTNILLIVTAYVIMELPFYLLFYKVSFKGHRNRSFEYSFGLKLSVFVLILLVLHFFSKPLLADLSQTTGTVSSLIILTILGTGIWYLMYRKKWSFCCRECPICSYIKKIFGKSFCRQEQEQEELQKSYEDAEKVAETIIEAEAQEHK